MPESASAEKLDPNPALAQALPGKQADRNLRLV
jgi:hypothetical protein